MGSISRNFSYCEFEKSDTATRYHIMNNIIDAKVRDAIKALVENVLQPLRDEYGQPMFINSGFRCQELNEKVGGVPTSQHCKGEAADVGCADPYKVACLARAMNLPYDQMILYPTFVHFSHKLDGEQRRQILYNKRYKGKRLE